MLDIYLLNYDIFTGISDHRYLYDPVSTSEYKTMSGDFQDKELRSQSWSVSQNPRSARKKKKWLPFLVQLPGGRLHRVFMFMGYVYSEKFPSVTFLRAEHASNLKDQHLIFEISQTGEYRSTTMGVTRFLTLQMMCWWKQ